MFPSKEQINLPSPTKQQLDDYNINKARFAFLIDVSSYKEAFKIILTKDKLEDSLYKRILPSSIELHFLEDITITR